VTRVDVAIRLAPMHPLESMRSGRERVADVVVVARDGGDRRELRRTAMVECIGFVGKQRPCRQRVTSRNACGEQI
jgi:hypothetical protein